MRQGGREDWGPFSKVLNNVRFPCPSGLEAHGLRQSPTPRGQRRTLVSLPDYLVLSPPPGGVDPSRRAKGGRVALAFFQHGPIFGVGKSPARSRPPSTPPLLFSIYSLSHSPPRPH